MGKPKNTNASPAAGGETTTKPPDFDLDLGIDPAAVETAIADGMKKGAESGMKDGATKAMKPAAAEAAEMAVNQMLSGGSNASIQQTLKALNDMTNIEMQNTLLDSIKDRQQQKRQTVNPQQATSNMGPMQNNPDAFNAMLAQMETLGMDKLEIIRTLRRKRALSAAMANPTLIPVLLEDDDDDDDDYDRPRGKRRHYQQQPSYLEQLAMARQQGLLGNSQPAPSQSSDIIAVMMKNMEISEQRHRDEMQQQQRHHEEMMTMLSQHNDEKFKLTMENLAPQLQHRSALDEISEAKQTLEALGVSIGGGGGQKSELEAKLEYEGKRMGMEVKKEELMMDLQDRIEERKQKKEDSQFEMFGKVMGWGEKLIKRLPIPTEPSAGALANPTQALGSPSGQPTVMQRVSRMLSRVQRAMPPVDENATDPEPPQEGQ